MLDLAVPVRANSPRFGGKPLGLVARCCLHLLVGWLRDGVCKTCLCPLGVLSPRGTWALGRKGDSRDAVMQPGSPPVPAQSLLGRREDEALLVSGEGTPSRDGPILTLTRRSWCAQPFAGAGPERLQKAASATGSGIAEQHHPFPPLFGRSERRCSSLGSVSEIKAESTLHGRVNFPFLQALPIYAGILWVVWETGNYPLFRCKTESSSPAGYGERLALPACGASPARGCLFRRRVPDESRVCAAGNARVKLPLGEIPLVSAGTAGGADGTGQELGFAEQLWDCRLQGWVGCAGRRSRLLGVRWQGSPARGDTAMQMMPPGKRGGFRRAQVGV